MASASPDAVLAWTASDTLTGSASYGRIYAALGAVIGSILGLVLFFWGVRKGLSDPFKAHAQARILEVQSCNLITRRGDTFYDCYVTLQFWGGGVEQKPENVRLVRLAPPYAGQMVTVHFAPEDPTNVSTETPPTLASLGAILGGCFIMAIAVGSALASYRDPGFAAAFGQNSLLPRFAL